MTWPNSIESRHPRLAHKTMQTSAAYVAHYHVAST